MRFCLAGAAEDSKALFVKVLSDLHKRRCK